MIKKYPLKTASNKASKSIIVLSCVLFLSVVVSSCSFFQRYDHHACLLKQVDVLFEDNNGNKYFEIENRTGCFCKYSDVPPLFYSYFNLNLAYENQWANYNFGTANTNYLFACLWYPSEISKPFVRIYNKSLDAVKTIEFIDGELARDMVCSDNYLYIYLENKNTGKDSFVRYDPSVEATTILIDDLEGVKTYQDEDIHVFFGKDYRFRHIGNYTNSKTRLLCYGGHFFSDNIELSLSMDSIVIKNNGTERKFKKQFHFTDIYQKVYVIDNHLLFAVFNQINSKKCPSGDFLCACELGSSYLFDYNLSLSNLSLIGQFENGTYLIDYDLDNVQYYYSGGLYTNDTYQKGCGKIEPKKLEKDENPLDESDFCLSFYKKEFYGIK